MINDFNNIASIYDRLARLVFGDVLHEAQCTFLNHVQPHSRILILGGGTGKMANELLDQVPTVHIDYVEASSEMLRLARKQIGHGEQVTFVHGTHEDTPGEAYDCIITPFVLDVFDAEHLKEVAKVLHERLGKHGVLICTDFRNTGDSYHRFLLWCMHQFFRTVNGLQSKQLQDIDEVLADTGFIKTTESRFRKGLVFSAVYTLPT